MRAATTRQDSFGDAELRAQSKLRGPLKLIAELLDRAPELVNMVHADLVAGLKKAQVGRQGLSAVQVLRAFIVQRIENLDLRSLAERIADGVSMRVFTTFDSQRVPGHDAFWRAFSRLTPQTVRQINELVLRQAVELEIEDGAKLRVDTTVVETDIRFPTDAGLLWDSVRVLTRHMHHVARLLPKTKALFHDRTRSAKRRFVEISRMSRQQRQHLQLGKYKDLLRTCSEVVGAARRVASKAAAKARAVARTQPARARRLQDLADLLVHFSALADQVLDQTRRRVLDGEQVPVEDKLFSIFEPHTDLIIRGKANKAVEFGHKVLLAESGAGLVTDYVVLEGNPADADHVVHSIDQHRRLFDRAPGVFATDRGFYHPDNLSACQKAGVELEAIPQRGGVKSEQRQAHEKSPAFRKAQRFRAGAEGRISVLMRGRGMRRCLTSGLERFEVFVGLAVLANNLLVIAARLEARSRRRRKRAA